MARSNVPLFPAACGIARVRDARLWPGCHRRSDARRPQFSECMNVTAHEGFEALAMSERDIHHAVVRIDQGEGIQLTRIARGIERAEVTQSTSKRSPAMGFVRTKASVADAPCVNTPGGCSIRLVTKWPQALFDDSRGDLRALLQPSGDVAFEGIEFARTAADRRSLCRCLVVFRDRAPAHFEMVLDFADGTSSRTSKAGAGR